MVACLHMRDVQRLALETGIPRIIGSRHLDKTMGPHLQRLWRFISKPQNLAVFSGIAAVIAFLCAGFPVIGPP